MIEGWQIRLDNLTAAIPWARINAAIFSCALTTKQSDNAQITVSMTDEHDYSRLV